MKKTKEQRREEEIKSEMGRCIHFKGIQNEVCKAGVNVRQLVGGPDFGWGARLPCLLMDAGKCEAECASRKLLTREEAETAVKEPDASLKRTLTAVALAHKHADEQGLGEGNGGASELPCPLECGGTLRYRVASYNGHMHAACSTKGCVSWVE